MRFKAPILYIPSDAPFKHDVVGIEVVGQQKFSIRELIKQVPVETAIWNGLVETRNHGSVGDEFVA